MRCSSKKNVQLFAILVMNNFFALIGEYTIFNVMVIGHFPKIIKRFREILKQMKRVGYDSLFLIAITSAFTGLVTSMQASYQTSGYIPESLIGVLVGKATMIELAPVLTGLVLTGKIGASLAAEIGTMRITGTDKAKFLSLLKLPEMIPWFFR